MFYHRILMIMAASLVLVWHEANGQEKDSEKLRKQLLNDYKLQAEEIADLSAKLDAVRKKYLKGNNVVHQRIAEYLLRESGNLETAASRLKAVGKLLPEVKMDHITDFERISWCSYYTLEELQKTQRCLSADFGPRIQRQAIEDFSNYAWQMRVNHERVLANRLDEARFAKDYSRLQDRTKLMLENFAYLGPTKGAIKDYLANAKKGLESVVSNQPKLLDENGKYKSDFEIRDEIVGGISATGQELGRAAESARKLEHLAALRNIEIPIDRAIETLLDIEKHANELKENPENTSTRKKVMELGASLRVRSSEIQYGYEHDAAGIHSQAMKEMLHDAVGNAVAVAFDLEFAATKERMFKARTTATARLKLYKKSIHATRELLESYQPGELSDPPLEDVRNLGKRCEGIAAHHERIYRVVDTHRKSLYTGGPLPPLLKEFEKKEKKK